MAEFVAIRVVKPPKVNNQPIPGIKREVIDALLNICSGPTRERDRAVMFFLADTGERASELTDLKMSDVDLVKGSAVIRHGKGGKRRVVYFGQKTRRELRKYLSQRKHADAPDGPQRDHRAAAIFIPGRCRLAGSA